MGRHRKTGIEEFLFAVIFAGVLFYAFVIQPAIEWIKQNAILSAGIGFGILLVIGFAGKLFLDHKKKKSHEWEYQKREEIKIAHRSELASLSEEQREILINKYFEEKYPHKSLLDRIMSLFSGGRPSASKKPARKHIPFDTKNKVYDTAHDKCQSCGEKYNLDIHHISGDRSNPNISNLILLCGNCHKKADKGAIPKWRLDQMRPRQFVKTDKGRHEKP